MIRFETRSPRSARLRAWVLHLFRWALFAAVVWMVRDQHARHDARLQGSRLAAVSVDQVKRFFPAAAALSQWNPERGGQTVLDSNGWALGYVVQTSPHSDAIVGYSGPTNTLIAFDVQDRIVGLEILRCGDTADHLQAVLADRRFLASFNGRSWQEAAGERDVDGVSGATLTSMAIVEGIARRLGGLPHSYRFPDPVTVQEVKALLPRAAHLAAWDQRPGLLRIEDGAGQLIGFAGRTSPAADDLIGFQGPTDTLFVMDAQQRVLGIAMRRSYDTVEYLEWINDDKRFLTRFNGRDLDELAALDLDAAGIEGVSGATMTSMAMAQALVRTAQAVRDAKPAVEPRRWEISPRDMGTAAVVFGGLLLAFTGLRGRPLVRVAFQLLLIVYIGFVNGDMVSQSLLVGWAQNGVAWRFAPGLVLLAAAAFLVPLATHRQVYCHHLCPHGAIQQLVRKLVPRRFRPKSGLPRWLSRALSPVPLGLLVWVVIVALCHLPYNLAAIEPFDAYVWRVAGWATVTIAIGGLAFSLLVPMAYCRFGCPTGAVLNFLRLQGAGDRLTRRDVAALALLGLAIGIRLLASP